MNFLVYFFAILIIVGTILFSQFFGDKTIKVKTRKKVEQPQPENSKKKIYKREIVSKEIKLDKFVLIIACALFVTFYFFRLFSVDNFNSLALNTTTGLFTSSQFQFMTILRFFTQGIVPIMIVVGYYNIKTLNISAGIWGFIIAFLNIIFFKWNLIAFEGASYSFFSWRAIEFIFETLLALIISTIFIVNLFKQKSKLKDIWKNIALGFVIVFGLGVIAMHPNTLQALFGAYLPEAEGFSFTHRLCLYLIAITGLILYFTIKNKSDDIKHVTCLMIAICGIIAFFITYTFVIPLTALPLHLCNAALIIGLFAFIFKSKKLFYFTYFVNVLGALCALLMPNTDGSILLSGNVRFWLTHITVILTPILAVAWRVFPRPNIKMMKNSIIVFTIYFIVACASNMWISNYDPEVNYFFLQDAFFVEKFPFAFPIRANFAYTFFIDNLSFTVYPLYWLCIYIVYIVAMFLIWLAYAYLYKVGDNFGKVNELRKLDVLNIRKYKSIQKGTNMDNEIVIKVENFTKVYGGSKTPSVDNFSLEVNKGEVFGFLGHNGAGKSTLIKSMVGIQSITSGSISICGFDITRQPLQAKLNIGYVSDNHAVYEKLTGREYINFIADLYLVSKNDRDERLDKYAKMFNLEKDIDREIKGYSHGMKQKLVVIASIIHEPKVWILDEPLTGLDPMSAHQIKALMRQKADEGHIVFFSSHVIEVVEKICDKIAIISHGKLKGIYNIDELEKGKYSLEDLYLEKSDSIKENNDK